MILYFFHKQGVLRTLLLGLTVPGSRRSFSNTMTNSMTLHFWAIEHQLFIITKYISHYSLPFAFVASIPPAHHNIPNKTIQAGRILKPGSKISFLRTNMRGSFLRYGEYTLSSSRVYIIIQHAFLAQIASLRTVFSSSSASPSYFRIIMPVSVDEAKVLLLNEKSF